MEARPGWSGGRSWEEGSPSDVAPSPPGAVVPQLGAGVGVGAKPGKVPGQWTESLGLEGRGQGEARAPKLPHPRAGRSGPGCIGAGVKGQRQAQSVIPGPRQG